MTAFLVLVLIVSAWQLVVYKTVPVGHLDFKSEFLNHINS
jgi:hypothetical protein